MLVSLDWPLWLDRSNGFRKKDFLYNRQRMELCIVGRLGPEMADCVEYSVYPWVLPRRRWEWCRRRLIFGFCWDDKRAEHFLIPPGLAGIMKGITRPSFPRE